MPPAGSLTPASLAFPDTPEGSASPAQSVTVTSTGGVALVLAAPSVTAGVPDRGRYVSRFAHSRNELLDLRSLSSRSDGSHTRYAYPAGEYLRRCAEYSPRRQWSLAPGVTHTHNPTSLQFNAEVIGSASPAQVIEVTNTGGAPHRPRRAGNHRRLCRVSHDLSGKSGRRASPVRCLLCSSRRASGDRPGQLTVPGGAAPSAVATLDGTGITPGSVTFMPLSLAFGLAAIGSTTAATLTAANPGGSFGFTSVQIAATGDFTIAGGTCGPSSVLAANGGSCTVTIAFTPALSGQLQRDTHTHRRRQPGAGRGGAQRPWRRSGQSHAHAPQPQLRQCPRRRRLPGADDRGASNSGALPVTLATPSLNARGIPDLRQHLRRDASRRGSVQLSVGFRAHVSGCCPRVC